MKFAFWRYLVLISPDSFFSTPFRFMRPPAPPPSRPLSPGKKPKTFSRLAPDFPIIRYIQHDIPITGDRTTFLLTHDYLKLRFPLSFCCLFENDFKTRRPSPPYDIIESPYRKRKNVFSTNYRIIRFSGKGIQIWNTVHYYFSHNIT